MTSLSLYCYYFVILFGCINMTKTIDIKTNLFSHADLSEVVNDLSLLSKELDDLLSQYQLAERRSEIEHLKSSCNPNGLLQGVFACLTCENDVFEVENDTRSIDLEAEFLAVGHVDMYIDYWCGETKSDRAEEHHEWLEDEELRKYPLGVYTAYESILCSYYSLFGIPGDRRDASNFWSKSIFHVRYGSDPAKEDADKWEAMQRAYFESQSKRVEFLNNLLAAVRNPISVGSFEEENSLVQVGSECGFVYLIRNGDLCKIGITENLLRRMDELKPDEILNVVRCPNFVEVEKQLHSRYKDVRLPQTEYFRLTEDQIQAVHKLFRDFPRY